ncbi:prepilin-type N-terminal cleavage/methylation domain-containing protein [Vibrio gigantis]|uniref:prepilin-type N-terminal cleavage/methylation domain-containing protein n=1 Tax=Vibrio gigantis TaxID=296199 RepID=UPI001EFC1ADF|nr:prepilin-type N-terminal cleavage/methylation domain-containing protein [Vibrio gigantis]ULN66910.1 prepilin-type N-terminal cleavage/methylation domain-containing protein [Vibrio gigantis]
MKKTSWHKGFTLLELIVVIVILAAIAVIAAPRFLSIADDARAATGLALFDNFRSSAEIYQGACLARGGDIEEPQTNNGYKSDFNIDGVYSNFTGTCYPVRNPGSNSKRRDIPNANGCYTLFQEMVNSDHLVDINFNSNGWTNGDSFDLGDLNTARDSGFQVYIHQARSYFSYCHYYNIEGDLSRAPFILYNAIDGEMVTGITDLTSGSTTWTNELNKYSVATQP